MASSIQKTWTWAKSGRWWGTRKLGVQQSMGLWRVRNVLATEKQQQQYMYVWKKSINYVTHSFFDIITFGAIKETYTFVLKAINNSNFSGVRIESFPKYQTKRKLNTDLTNIMRSEFFIQCRSNSQKLYTEGNGYLR